MLLLQDVYSNPKNFVRITSRSCFSSENWTLSLCVEVQVLLKMQLSSAEVCHHQTGARWLAAQRPIDVLTKPNAGEITPLILVLVLSTVNSILNGSGNHVGFLGGEWVACHLS
jgi:hypothetical protein